MALRFKPLAACFIYNYSQLLPWLDFQNLLFPKYKLHLSYGTRQNAVQMMKSYFFLKKKLLTDSVSGLFCFGSRKRKKKKVIELLGGAP